MDPVQTMNAAIVALDALLSIINAVRAQGGMSDDEILAAAQTQTTSNTAQIQKLLANLPPK